MYLVIGSGPSGISCAEALLQRGARVTMLDIGADCEPERMAAVARLGATDPQQWSAADLSTISPPAAGGSARKIPLKLAFGSDFAYAKTDTEEIHQDGTRCVMSSAVGGLSNVWGAAMLPFRQEELVDWPVTARELAPHYEAVAQMVGLACGPDDGLTDLYPHRGTALLPEPGEQARLLLDRMQRHGERLRSQGIRFGTPRLALDRSRCRQCQRCLTGCVYGAVYCTTRSLEALKRHPSFTYRAGVRVLLARDQGEGVELLYREADAGEVRVLIGQRVFVGAGVLATSRIMALSLGMERMRLGIQYHPYFLLPMLMWRNVPRVESERLYALAQFFIEIVDPTVSEHTVHLQAYTYSPLFLERIQAMGPLSAVARRLLLGRLVALQGFLHSRKAEPIALAIESDSLRLHTRLVLRAGDRQAARQDMRAVGRKLLRNARMTGLLPLTPAMEVGVPGDGNHIGGTFPMADLPGPLQSDRLGRVGSLRRVHVVDASVFPSIPASTITFTAMANARRIATEACALD